MCWRYPTCDLVSRLQFNRHFVLVLSEISTVQLKFHISFLLHGSMTCLQNMMSCCQICWIGNFLWCYHLPVIKRKVKLTRYFIHLFRRVLLLPTVLNARLFSFYVQMCLQIAGGWGWSFSSLLSGTMLSYLLRFNW